MLIGYLGKEQFKLGRSYAQSMKREQNTKGKVRPLGWLQCNSLGRFGKRG